MSAMFTIHRPTGRLTAARLGTLVAVAAAMALSSPAASASQGYPSFPNTAFGGPCGGTPCGGGQFSEPVGVAVDESDGDVYVVDAGDNRVEKFNSEGTYISQITGVETPAGSFSGPRAVVVDNSASPDRGDVYVADIGHSVIDVFDSSGKYLSQIVGTPGAFAGKLLGVAVDGAGNVWAYEENGNVDKFSDTWSFLGQFNTGRGTEAGLVVGSEGNVYLLFFSGQIGKYSPSGSQLGEFGGLGGTALAVDRSASELFELHLGSVEGYSTSGQLIETFGTGISSAHGIAVNGKTHVVYASEGEADTIAVFDFGNYPTVTTGATSEVKRTATKLEGMVNPEGEALTSCEFEYGTTSAYGQVAPCVPSAVGSGGSPVAVSAEVSGLSSATAYHYRLVAGNANGRNAGTDISFTTWGAVEGVYTQLASEVLGTSATINGSLEPNGFDTHYWFEYGPPGDYSSSTTHQDAGEANGPEAVSVPLSGLEPNTAYGYRLATENVLGVTLGGGETFTTQAVSPVLGPLPASGITRVNATISVDVNPEKSPTSWRILYGETSAYGEHTPEFGAGGGLGETPVRLALEGLRPDTTYHYAVQATNQAGTVTEPDQTFTTAPPTPPGAITGAASNIALTTAMVAGTIEPNELGTSYVLEFGTSAEYGTSISGEAGAGGEPVEVVVPLQYLAPGTTYHYRFVAISSDGRTYGSDQTFTTPAYSHPIVLPATLPLIAIPAIAFPTETSGTIVKPTSGKKKQGKKGGKRKTRRKARRSRRRRKG